MKSFIRKVVLGLILFFVISYLIITKTKAKQMGERGLQILVIILILTTILTLVGLNLSRSHIPRLRKIDVQPGKKGERGDRGEMGKAANPLAECKDDMCYRKIMDHITNVVNLWNKVRGLPLIPQGTFIKNKYLQGKVMELCESPQLKELLKKNGAHKLTFRDDISSDKCSIESDCGAYDYIFQKWTEWILIILKYRNGRDFINSPLLTENEFNNMIHLTDFEKQDNQKDTINGNPLWLFPTKTSLGGNTMGMVLNPSDENVKEVEKKFKQSTFYKYYSKNGVPSAHLVTEGANEELRLKQIDSPFEEIKRYDAWYWGANETGLPKLINQCNIEDSPTTQYKDQIKIKLTNDYTHIWNSSEARQIKCNSDGTHYFHKLPLGEPEINIYRPNNYVDEAEENLFFKNYKPVGYVCFKTNSSNQKTSVNDILPLGKRYDAINQNISAIKTGPKNLTILVSGDIKPPIDFIEIVSLKRTEGFEKNRKKFTIWRPVAPSGYVTLGDIVDVGADSVKPDIHSIVCIPKSCIKEYKSTVIELFNSNFNNKNKIKTDYDYAECKNEIVFTDETFNFTLHQISLNENLYDNTTNIIKDLQFNEKNELNKPLLKIKREELVKLKKLLEKNPNDKTIKKEITTQNQELNLLIKKIYDYKKPEGDSNNINIQEEQDVNPIRFLPFLKPYYFFRAKINKSNDFEFYEIDDNKLLPNILEIEPYTIVKKEKNPIRYSILNIYNL